MKGNAVKYRICEKKSATNFLEATRYFKDSVFSRTSLLKTVEDVFGQDIYVHKDCLRQYIIKYERAVANDNKSKIETVRQDVIDLVTNHICPLLRSGKGYALTNIRDDINKALPAEKHLITRQVKSILITHFKEEISFSKPIDSNQSPICFLKSIKPEEMAEVIRTSSDSIKNSAQIIRDCLLKVEFNLNDSFCDAVDLQTAWDTKIPEPFLLFLGTLFNIDVEDTRLQYNNVEEMSSIYTKFHAIFQILVYNLNKGKMRTPMHLANAQAIHETCKSATLIKSFNRLGLSSSYDEVRKYHNDMAMFTISSTENNLVPIPSHLDPLIFTIGAVDNFDHEETTTSGIKGTHDTVSIICQNKSNNSLAKPKISETAVKLEE